MKGNEICRNTKNDSFGAEFFYRSPGRDTLAWNVEMDVMRARRIAIPTRGPTMVANKPIRPNTSLSMPSGAKRLPQQELPSVWHSRARSNPDQSENPQCRAIEKTHAEILFQRF